MNVLIIDDDPNVHRILSRVISRLGHKSFTAFGGEPGLKLLQEQQVDLIFLDIYMPGMSGLTVLHNLKADQDLNEIPVVVMTAFFTNENIANVIGAHDIFSKSNLVQDATRVIERLASA